jgi:hypothetical protein
MNPIREALEIVEIMMATKSLAGLGRLHCLLMLVQDVHFDAEEFDAVPLREDDARLASMDHPCDLCGEPCYPWEHVHKHCMDYEAMLADMAPPVNSPDEE